MINIAVNRLLEPQNYFYRLMSTAQALNNFHLPKTGVPGRQLGMLPPPPNFFFRALKGYETPSA
jgi:hypothetical protein